MKKSPILMAAVVFSLGATLGTSAYAQKKIKVIKSKPAPAANTAPVQSAEPDKILYDKALDFMKHGHYTEARLNFQTLINTYPDSEYLAKGKLGTADSFYKEGGDSNMVQAIAEYKDFITFFPFLDEAAYAQMQVGLGHFRMMEKPDRDNSQAEQAEQEFQTFLLKYPQSPLTPKAEQYLREVQEVLADGEFKIGRYYYLRARQYPAAYPAATARLMEVAERYPLYSAADETLWMLGDIYMRAKQASKNEDDRNHWADLAGECYDRILKNYPLSSWAPQAKSQLTGMGMAVPAADPDAIKRMKQQQLYVKDHHSTRASLMGMPMGLFKSNPDVSVAARSGTPNLSAPDDVISATDVLKKGATGPTFDANASAPAADANANGADTESSTPVEAVPVSASGSGGISGGSGIGAEIIAAPASDAAAEAPAASTASSTGAANGAAPIATAVPEAAAPASGDPPAGNSVGSADANGASPATGANGVTGSSGDTTSQGGQAASGDAQPAAAQPTAAKSDSSTESTSKKKKGLKKIIPF